MILNLSQKAKRWLKVAIVLVVIIIVAVAAILISKSIKKESFKPSINLLTKERFKGMDAGNNDPLNSYIDTWIDAEIGEAK